MLSGNALQRNVPTAFLRLSSVCSNFCEQHGYKYIETTERTSIPADLTRAQDIISSLLSLTSENVHERVCVVYIAL